MMQYVQKHPAGNVRSCLSLIPWEKRVKFQNLGSIVSYGNAACLRSLPDSACVLLAKARKISLLRERNPPADTERKFDYVAYIYIYTYIYICFLNDSNYS